MIDETTQVPLRQSQIRYLLDVMMGIVQWDTLLNVHTLTKWMMQKYMNSWKNCLLHDAVQHRPAIIQEFTFNLTMDTIEEVMLDRWLLENLESEQEYNRDEKVAADLEITVDELYRRMHPGHS